MQIFCFFYGSNLRKYQYGCYQMEEVQPSQSNQPGLIVLSKASRVLTYQSNYLFLRLPLVLKYICCEYQINKTAIILLLFNQLNPSLEARSVSEIPFLQIPMSSMNLIPLIRQNVPYELLIHIIAHAGSWQYLMEKQRSYLLYVIKVPCAHQQLLLCNSANDSQSKGIEVLCISLLY